MLVMRSERSEYEAVELAEFVKALRVEEIRESRDKNCMQARSEGASKCIVQVLWKCTCLRRELVF